MIKNINLKEKRIITNEDLHDMIVDSFDKFFTVIDENTKEIKSELTSMFKREIKKEMSDLKKEMNQRFSIVDKKFVVIDDRLSNIDDKLSDIDDKLCSIENSEVYKNSLPKKFA